MFGNRHSLYGTEDDPVNCSFFLRMGACRHGNNCPKKHPIPAFSQTVMFQHLWIAPKKILKDKRAKQAHYEDFYEDVLEECMKFGEVENILVVQNMGDHMIGNVFIRFVNEEVAEKCVNGTRGRFYAGRKVHVCFSPVQDFAHSRCNDFQDRTCSRGQFCNFAHYMATPRWATKYFATPDSRRRYRSVKRSGSSSKSSREPSFPIRGTSQERRRVIEQWNKVREEKGILKTFDKPPKAQHPSGDAQASRLNLFRPGEEEKK